MELWGYPVGDLYLREATMVPTLQHRGNKGTGQDLVWEKGDNRYHRTEIAYSVETVGCCGSRVDAGNIGGNLSGGKFVTTEIEDDCHPSLKSDVYAEA